MVILLLLTKHITNEVPCHYSFTIEYNHKFLDITEFSVVILVSADQTNYRQDYLLLFYFDRPEISQTHGSIWLF